MGIISTFIRLCAEHRAPLVAFEPRGGGNNREDRKRVERSSDLYCGAGRHWPEVIGVANACNRQILFTVNVVEEDADEI